MHATISNNIWSFYSNMYSYTCISWIKYETREKSLACIIDMKKKE